MMNNYSKEAANKIRALSLRLVHKAKASHIGSALSIADLLAVLITNDDVYWLPSPKDVNRDRLILSKGHACVALYSALFLKGFYEEEELFSYGEDYSDFMNHASHKVPGVEFSTGALGHALSISCGKALYAKLNNKKWHNFVILSDGELQEGSNWEAIMFANQYKLNNLTILIDFNNLQSLTTIDNTIAIEPIDEKLQSFGWDTKIINGHDHNCIYESLKSARNNNKPTAVILNTIKGKGVDFMENKVAWHYKNPNDIELEKALNSIN